MERNILTSPLSPTTEIVQVDSMRGDILKLYLEATALTEVCNSYSSQQMSQKSSDHKVMRSSEPRSSVFEPVAKQL